MRRSYLARFCAALLAAGFLASVTLSIDPLASVVLVFGAIVVTTSVRSHVSDARAGPNSDRMPMPSGKHFNDAPQARTAPYRGCTHNFGHLAAEPPLYPGPTRASPKGWRMGKPKFYPGPIRASPA